MSSKGAASGPKFVAMFGPVLTAVRDLGGSARPQEVYERVAQMLKLSEATRGEQTSSGTPRYENQMAWARYYLVLGGYLDASKRGVWSLTEQGRAHPSLTPEETLALFHRIRAEMAKEAKKVGAAG